MFVKILMRLNVFLYEISRGAIGSKMGGQNVLLLHTVGRKTGKTYITPTNYFKDGDSYVVVASNWGKKMNPGWFYNLISQGKASIQIKDLILQVEARQLDDSDYDRLWNYITSLNGFYTRYQERAGRKIPLIRLTGTNSQEGSIKNRMS